MTAMFGYGRVWMMTIQSSSPLGKRRTLSHSRLVTCRLLADFSLFWDTSTHDARLIPTETFCNAATQFTAVGGVLRCFLSFTERQAGDSKLQQHSADPHVSRRRSRWHPDPVHYQRHTCHLQQQRLESRCRIQVLKIVE